LKKNIVFFGIFLFVTAAVGWGATRYYADRAFLSSLKGEVVFVQRDGDILNLYLIGANGTNKRKINANGSNSLFPRWENNKTSIHFYTLKDEKWEEWIVSPSGQLLGKLEGDFSGAMVSRSVRSDDLVVKKGSLYVKDKNNSLRLIYRHSNYDNKFNTGANEASWSPDRRHIIFQSYGVFRGSQIFVADATGERVVKLTDGEMPDWR
jgi:Tol biopolymer transport system component